MDVRTIQRYLGVQADGKLGPLTHNAIASVLAARALKGDLALPHGWQSWKPDRRLQAVVQIMLHDAGIDAGAIDGLRGPQTDYALSVWQDRMRDVVPTQAEVEHLPTIWPRQADVPNFYGQPGQNQVMLELPYPMRLAWDLNTVVHRFSIHEKVHDSAKRVLAGAWAHYGMEGIVGLRLDLWGGCLNVRNMRGGNNLSMHSWGIAIDIDPDRNQLRWDHLRAQMASASYNVWWDLWEKEGWVSLGRERDYDWMHVQAARL